MERPLKDQGTGFEHLGIWDEQPSIRAGLFWGVLLVVAATLATIIYGG